MTPDAEDRLDTLIRDALDDVAAEFTPSRPQAAVRARVRLAAGTHRRRTALAAVASLTSAAAAVLVAGVFSQPTGTTGTTGTTRNVQALQEQAPAPHQQTAAPTDVAYAGTRPLLRLGRGDDGKETATESGATVVVRLADTQSLRWTAASSANPKVLAVLSVQRLAHSLQATFHTSGIGTALLQARAVSSCAPTAPQNCSERPNWSAEVAVFAMSGGTAARPG